MKTISWTSFKTVTAEEIVTEGECVKLTKDGDLIGYLVVRPEQLMKNRVEGICSQIDASRGF